MTGATTERLVKLARWKNEGKQRFTVRVFDMFDGWCDCMDATNVDAGMAMCRWMEYTGSGHKNVKYSDGDYYDVFPADTQMLVTPEYLGRD